jgi:hypothetical protein
VSHECSCAEDPAVLWQREGRLTRELSRAQSAYPTSNAQWIEDRFWVWVHYAGTKLGRGELFEACDFISFLRTTVLGPLALSSVGARPSGVRRLEQAAPDYARYLQTTVAPYDVGDCRRALLACVDFYRALRSEGPPIHVNHAAESAAVRYVSVMGY